MNKASQPAKYTDREPGIRWPYVRVVRTRVRVGLVYGRLRMRKGESRVCCVPAQRSTFTRRSVEMFRFRRTHTTNLTAGGRNLSAVNDSTANRIQIHFESAKKRLETMNPCDVSENMADGSSQANDQPSRVSDHESTT